MTLRQPDPYEGPRTFGIDVSRYQGTVDWTNVSRDVKFVIARTGDGKTPDIQFDNNWKGLKANGFVRGSYHYFRTDRGGDMQAKLVMDLIDAAGGYERTDLPPALDIEDGALKNLPGGVVAGTTDIPVAKLVEEALEFLDTVQSQMQVTPIIYTGQTFHWKLSQSNPDLAKEFSKYPLWTPYYASTARIPADKDGNYFPWKNWTIWQYTSKEQVQGFEEPIDANFFRGDFEVFKKFVATLNMQENDFTADSVRAEMAKLIKRLASLQETLDTLK